MAYFSNDLYAGTLQIGQTVAIASSVGVGKLTPVPLGKEIAAYDSTYGSDGLFVFQAVPVSTAIATGTICYVDASGYVVALPAVSTSKKTGRAVVVAVNAFASDSANIQYGWFLVKGTTATLKTAVTVPADSAVYIGTTAGRMYLTASAGAQIIGARTVNAASVTSTTSTVLVRFNRSSVQGFA